MPRGASSKIVMAWSVMMMPPFPLGAVDIGGAEPQCGGLREQAA
jgi:hypothetical protein